jgi:hypothetical protein
LHIDQYTDITLLLYQSFDVCLLRHHRLKTLQAQAQEQGQEPKPDQAQAQGHGGSPEPPRRRREYRQSEHSVRYTDALRQATIDYAENTEHQDLVDDDPSSLVQVWGSGFILQELDATHCRMAYTVQLNISDPVQAIHANLILDNLCRNRPLCIRRFEAYVRQYIQAHGGPAVLAQPSDATASAAVPTANNNP